MERLYVLYDARCGLCSWAKRWLLRQPALIDLRFIPAGSGLAERLFPGLDRAGDPPEELVRIAVRPNEVLIKTERAMIYSRLVEGRFPPYQQVIPQKHPIKVPLVVGPFHTAVRQAAIMTDDESKKVTFSFAKKKLTMQARGAATGRSKVAMRLEYEGKAIDIGFDPKYVTEMLRVLNAEDALTLELVDGNSVALFSYGADYSYIAMPLT